MNDASTREWVWTLAWFVVLLAVAAAGAIVTYRYRQYRKPDPVTGKHGNGAGKWIAYQNLLLYVLLGVVSFSFASIGFSAMQTPEPIRAQNQDNSDLVANVLIGAAIAVAVYALVNLWLIFKIDREVDKEIDAKAKAAAVMMADRTANIADRETNVLAATANIADAAANAADSQANSEDALANASDAAANASAAADIARQRGRE